MTYGSITSSSAPTGRNPTSHSVHVIWMPVADFTISSASRLGASAVTNIELVTQVVANATHIKYAPIARGDSPGRDPYSSGMLRMIGKIVPALRAEFDGVNGASSEIGEGDRVAQAERLSTQVLHEKERDAAAEPRPLVAHRDHERREDQPDRAVGKSRQRPLQRFGRQSKCRIGALPLAERQAEHRA